ncbi:hypothetical protein FGIG_11958 [Fasciola gigantica]|uniref:Uncharacterized protein n=1 Tax=Fasciola gigantica TaxID=46835 RepID=A0A504YFX7_FASGI|nr:hypothetical protein FGIG_11958 [Fasciola gigantica]
MQAQKDTFSGGVFQYIPFNGTKWIPDLLLCGLSDTYIQFMLSVCALLVIIQLVLIFGCVLKIICSTSRSHHPAPNFMEQLKAEKLIESSEPDLSSEFESRASATSLELEEWDFEAALNSLVSRNRNKFSEDVVNGTETIDMTTRMTSTRLKAIKPYVRRTEKPVTKFLSPDSAKLVNSSRRRLIFLSVIASFFAICYIVYLTSLIVAIRTDHAILEALEILPHQGHWLAIQGLGFIQFGLDSAYSLMRAHIRNDAARLDGQSHLRHLVEWGKTLGSEAVACLIEPCSHDNNNSQNKNSSNEAILLFPSHTDKTSNIQRNNSLPRALLITFDLILSRMTALFEAAMSLNTQMIQTTERAWYEYRQGLSQIVPFQPSWMPSSENSHSWKSSVLLTKIHRVICENLSLSSIFTSCEQVGLYLHSFVTHANGLPAMLPPKNLQSVVQFASLPRALHAEQLVSEWLPVLADLPGKGGLFLLEKYLIPEMNRLKNRISAIVTSAPSAGMISQYSQYTRYFSTSMTLIFTTLLASSLALLVTTCCGLFRTCVKFRDRANLSEARIDSNSTFSMKISQEKAVCLLRCTRSCPCLRWTVWSIVMTICLLLATLATGLVYASTLVQNQACLYMFHGPAQEKADLLLTDGLRSFSYHLDVLKPLLDTSHLSLAIPNPILQTLDSDYLPGQVTLLSSLHWNRPVNFTALLHSSWFNRILRSQWDIDVRKKLDQMDLAVLLPKLQLDQVFNQVVQSMQLERSFDQLPVLPLDQYLNNPGPAYVVELHRVLIRLDTKESRQLAILFKNVSKAYEAYSSGHRTAEDNLVKIRNNRQLIEPARFLVAKASVALNRLNQLTHSELIVLVDQVVTHGWPEFLPCVDDHLIPFLMPLLDDLIPYPGLQSIYRGAVGLMCPLPINATFSKPNAYTSSIVSLNPEMYTLGSSLFASAVALTLAGLLSLFIP